MKSFVAMRIAGGAFAAWAGLLGGPTIAADTSPPASAQVVRARNACFSAAIRITGFLVAREEARVALDAPGFKVTEILVAEGDRVTAGQVLARLTRLAGDLPDAGPGRTPGAPPASAPPARPTTATLKAPAAGTVTRIMGTVGTT